MATNVRHPAAAKAIYGLITVQSVLLVLRDHPPAAWQIAVTLIGTTLTLALVETYAETIAVMLHHRRRLTRAEVRDIWQAMAPILIGAQAPTIVFLLAAMGAFSMDWAFQLALLVLFGFLFGYGLRIGRLLQQHWPMQLLSGLIVVLIAGALVAMKALPLFH